MIYLILLVILAAIFFWIGCSLLFSFFKGIQETPLDTFVKNTSRLYREDIDTSYDIETNFSGSYFMGEMELFYDRYDLKDEMIIGKFIDYYDAEKDTVFLCCCTMEGCTAISVATACHEVGHAVAYRRGFTQKNIAAEKEATRLALDYLKHEIETGFFTQEQYAVAERFLNTMLKTYK